MYASVVFVMIVVLCAIGIGERYLENDKFRSDYGWI
jgi:hypothetical protein